MGGGLNQRRGVGGQRGPQGAISPGLDPGKRTLVEQLGAQRSNDRELRGRSVRRDTIQWELEPITPGAAQHLPKMYADVPFLGAARTVIIDTKFYDKAFLSRFDSADKLRPGHLYQRAAYVRNIASRGETDATAAGVFLYPEDMAWGAPGGKLSIGFPRRVAGSRSMSASRSLDSATTSWQRTSASARRSVCARVHVALEDNSHVGV